jgi:cupin fold WbuC family metalloprotein
MLGHKLDENLIQQLLEAARLSPRLRANHGFHQPHERLQRMVNVALLDSYFAPHQHKAPGKLEIFTILRGRVMVVTFKDNGEVDETCCLNAEAQWNRAEKSDSKSPILKSNFALQVEIPPGAWHSLVILSSEAVMYEVIDGFYDPLTHKQFAPWAPPESDRMAASEYLKALRDRITRDDIK